MLCNSTHVAQLLLLVSFSDLKSLTKLAIASSNRSSSAAMSRAFLLSPRFLWYCGGPALDFDLGLASTTGMYWAVAGAIGDDIGTKEEDEGGGLQPAAPGGHGTEASARGRVPPVAAGAMEKATGSRKAHGLSAACAEPTSFPFAPALLFSDAHDA